jgi:hypothetical protein
VRRGISSSRDQALGSRGSRNGDPLQKSHTAGRESQRSSPRRRGKGRNE